MERYGDTVEGMVASAMEYLRRCREASFGQVVVSIKSSNVRVMVQAYRMLVAAMRRLRECAIRCIWASPRRATTARDASSRPSASERCSATASETRSASRSPRLPSGKFRSPGRWPATSPARENHAPIPDVDESLYSPYEYRRRMSAETDGIGGNLPPVIASEIPGVVRSRLFEARVADIDSIPDGRVVLLSTDNLNGVAEQRAFFLKMIEKGKTNPVVIRRTYDERDAEALQVKAAADLGPLLLDGFGDGIWIENRNGAVAQDEIDATSLAILQAARVRVSKAEYIACPSCGRTLYDIERTLSAIKARTSHLRGIRIGVMGCIVNGPGEMGRRRLRLCRVGSRPHHAVQRQGNHGAQHSSGAGARRAGRADPPLRRLAGADTV